MKEQLNRNNGNLYTEESNALKEIAEFILAFLFTIGICGALFLYFWGRLSHIPETFSDIIIEHPAITGLTKSGELQLFWCLLPLGFLLLSLILLLLRKASFKLKALQDFFQKYIPPYFILLLLPCLLRYGIYQTLSMPLLIGMALLLLSYIFFRDIYKEILLTILFTYYGVLSIFTVISHFTPKGNVSSMLIYIVTLVISLFFLGLCIIFQKKSMIPAAVRLLQLLLPFLLAVFLVDTYLYQDAFIRIPYAPFYYLFFGILFLFFETSMFSLWKKKDRLVSMASPILIFIYNSFSAAPMYAQPDQHHHGEQMIPWQQVFELGQKLYTEYTPVSGLFPMVNGTIQNIFLNGTVSDYSPSISITIVLFSILTMYLLAKHTGTCWALCFAVLFALPSYNRQYMVLPVLLLLTLPKLVEKKGLWLPIYVFGSFLSGLYYPLFGAALLLGLAPFGIWQLVTYIKSKVWREDFKKPSFYISWLVCLIPIFLAIPLLFKLLNHTLTYSSQTVLADGISLLGQSAPSHLFPFLSDGNLKNMCYVFLRFFLPMVSVWLLFYLLLKYILVSAKGLKKTKKLSCPSLLFGLAAGTITLLFSYSYTLVRADYNMILSRTAPVLIAVLGMFLPVLLISYGKRFSQTFVLFVVAVSFSLPMILYTKVEDMKFPNMWVYPNGNSDILLDDSDKLFTYYTVPDGFFRADELDISEEIANRLGVGFLIEDQVHYINDYEKVIQKCDAVSEDTTYLGFDGQGFYYFNHVKACATGFIPAAKGYAAQKSIIETAEKNPPVIFLINGESNYYLYYWMWENEYRYKAEDHAFYPAKLYELIYGNESSDDYLDYYTGEEYGHQLGLIPSSFGSSMDTLSSLFIKEKNIVKALEADAEQEAYNYQADFSGREYDFLYLEISPATPEDIDRFPPGTVTISFQATDIGDETAKNRVQSVACTIKDGKLLIPMGMNPNWLLNRISSITITANSAIDGETSPLDIQITKACLLKIRQ
ncbi:MAG: hypothetical protein NC412_14745 [Roseburia sp.]|nr:hypothetical protein [Roseburia sp.]MCM1280207.1 hypothetical protein [Robinsoniella sp.]